MLLLIWNYITNPGSRKEKIFCLVLKKGVANSNGIVYNTSRSMGL